MNFKRFLLEKIICTATAAFLAICCYGGLTGCGQVASEEQWKLYDEPEYEEGNPIFSHDFMYSENQYIHMSMRQELGCILYDYEQETRLGLLEKYWDIERIIPLSNGFYHALLHQDIGAVRGDDSDAEKVVPEQGVAVRISCLFHAERREYLILYAICDSGDRESYENMTYMSQMQWRPFSREDYSEELEAALTDPYFEIYETSNHMALLAAMLDHLDPAEYSQAWTVADVKQDHSLVSYYLTSEKKSIWFCLDVYADEYAAENFLPEGTAIPL